MTASVRRDDFGIPHLQADSALELARLQGRVAAEDRAWQLTWFRWRMEGRTAEHVGPRGLPWDRFARQVGLEQTVRECYEQLDDETRSWVAAYVDGVNEGMPLGWVRAPEARALGLGETPPRAWEPWTPLGIFWAIHLLFGSFPSKLFNAHVTERLGADWLECFDAEGITQAGSNAWVVAGSRTANGLPLIAGDPHRTIELPGAYAQVRLTCPEFDVAGFTFPGVPGVQHFAHAGDVAWGITNAMADYQDLTREELRRTESGALEARGVDGWEPVDESSATIAVRGASSVVVPVVVTRRGPVITGLADVGERKPTGAADAGPAAYSLRTPSQTERDLGFAALLPLLRARSVDDVEAALRRWVEPVNSAVVADREGAVRHLVVGRVAQRHPDNLHGPVDSWDPRHEWTGWMSGPVTPVDDVMVSANDRASGGGMGVEYATPFRADRIRELIGDRVGLTPDDFAAIHVDTLNGQAAPMRELLGRVTTADPAAEALRVRLLAWDGRSDAGSADAAVFAAWRHELVRRFVDHPALAPLHEPSGHSALFAAWLSVAQQVGSGWYSMVAHGDAHGVDVTEAARVALEHVAAQDDTRTWGERHRFDPLHALDGSGDEPVAPPSGLSGDRGCVLAASSYAGVTDLCYVGPVTRYVWDLGSLDESRWVVPMGASGVAGDPHWDDQHDLWATGRLVPVGGAVGDVESAEDDAPAAVGGGCAAVGE